MNGPCKIRLLYDGDCPLSSREIRFLEKRDRGQRRGVAPRGPTSDALGSESLGSAT